MNPDDIKELETVDVIAGGYEWICGHPDCGRINRLIEYTLGEKVECSRCGEEFETNFPDHAFS